MSSAWEPFRTVLVRLADAVAVPSAPAASPGVGTETDGGSATSRGEGRPTADFTKSPGETLRQSPCPENRDKETRLEPGRRKRRRSARAGSPAVDTVPATSAEKDYRGEAGSEGPPEEAAVGDGGACDTQSVFEQAARSRSYGPTGRAAAVSHGASRPTPEHARGSGQSRRRRTRNTLSGQHSSRGGSTAAVPGQHEGAEGADRPGVAPGGAQDTSPRAGEQPGGYDGGVASQESQESPAAAESKDAGLLAGALSEPQPAAEDSMGSDKSPNQLDVLFAPMEASALKTADTADDLDDIDVGSLLGLAVDVMLGLASRSVPGRRVLDPTVLHNATGRR